MLERLRAHVAANPGDVAVVTETLQQNAELDAYAELSKLTTTWKRRRTEAEREAHLALQELSREWRRRVRERLARELPTREAVNAALDQAVLAGCLRVHDTNTVQGMPVPVLDNEPFPLTRVKHLPAPPSAPVIPGPLSSWKQMPLRKRLQCRPAWLTLVRAVQKASRRSVSVSEVRRRA